ncbi:MAG: ATP-dependent protease ATPase subunit HslU [Fusobacteriaceae bacterium]
MKEDLTPKKIVEELDRYIISQDEAKKSVAISLRNRHRRKNIEDNEMRSEITPKNIILIGSTGVGKTEIARRLAKIARAPFIKVEATKYTEIGYVGNDVESIIKDLANIAHKQVREERIEILKKEKYSLALERIAKIYKPYDTLNDAEKEKIIKEIEAGVHDNEEIEVTKTEKENENPHVIEVIGGNEPEDVENILSNIMGSMKNLGDRGQKTVKMKISSAINHILNEEVEQTIAGEDIISEVVERVQEDGIVFIDEIDKIVEREDSSRGEVSRQGVQRDILPIVEGCTVITKFGPIKTDHILFIAAGAFSQSSPSDIMPELQGRFPVKVKLENLQKEDFVKILTQVKYNLLEQYETMLIQDNVQLKFQKSGIDEIAELAIRFNDKIENVGARRLHMILENLLRQVMFEAPYEEMKKITIDRKYVSKVFKNEYEEENLDKYIL